MYWGCHRVIHRCEGQRPVWGSQFSSPIMWVPGIYIRISSGLVKACCIINQSSSEKSMSLSLHFAVRCLQLVSAPLTTVSSARPWKKYLKQLRSIIYFIVDEAKQVGFKGEVKRVFSLLSTATTVHWLSCWGGTASSPSL